MHDLAGCGLGRPYPGCVPSATNMASSSAPQNSGKCKCTFASQVNPPLRVRHCDTSRVSAAGPRDNPSSQSHPHRLQFNLTWLFPASRGKQLSHSSLPRHTQEVYPPFALPFRAGERPSSKVYTFSNGTTRKDIPPWPNSTPFKGIITGALALHNAHRLPPIQPLASE
jgi:hypothetical protein